MQAPDSADARSAEAGDPAGDGPEGQAHESSVDGADAELSATIAAAASGDQAAWRRLVDLYGRRVFALVRSRLRRVDLAEEVTQSVFVTVATKLSAGQYAERGRFEAWLFRVAVNRVRDEIRRLRRHAEPTDPEVLGQTLASRADAAQTDLGPLRAALAKLTDQDREIVTLRHHAGLSFAQIAQMLDEPLGTLLARHHRALRKIKGLMTGDAAPTGDDASADGEDAP